MTEIMQYAHANSVMKRCIREVMNTRYRGDLQ